MRLYYYNHINKMEKFNAEGYRNNLAKDLKSIENHGERKDALESEQGSWRYMTAQEKHLIAIGEHPEKVRLERLKEISNEKNIAPRVKERVDQLLKKYEADGHIFDEEESYYSNSSHCEWDNLYADLLWLGDFDDAKKNDDRFFANRIMGKQIRRVAGRSQDEKVKDLPKSLEKFGLIGYMLSAVTDEMDFENNPKKWFHLPLSGAATTLGNNIFIHEEGTDKEYTRFGRDAEILSISEKIGDIVSSLSSARVNNENGSFKGYDPEKRQVIMTKLQELKDQLAGIESGLAEKIISEVDVLTQNLEKEEAELKKEEAK